MAAAGPYEGGPAEVPPELLEGAQAAGGEPVEASGDQLVDPAAAQGDLAAQAQAPDPPEPTAAEAIEHAIVKMAEAATMAANGQDAQGFGTGVRNLADALLTLVKAELAPEEAAAENQLRAAQTTQALMPPEPREPDRPAGRAPSRS